MVPNSQKLLLVAVLYAATLGAIFLLHARAGGQYYYSTKLKRGAGTLVSKLAMGKVMSSSQNQRYSAYGPNMNCVQSPLDEFEAEEEKHFLPLDELERRRMAYAWYATSAKYLCSALTALKLLKDSRNSTSAKNLPFTVDYVLIHVADDLNDQVSQRLLWRWRNEGGQVKHFHKSLRHYFEKDSYYQASYHKFYSFLLTGYDRVVFLDSDGIPLRDLEHLFRLRLGAAEVAAPQAYWFKQEGVTAGSAKCPGRQVTLMTTALMVFHPSEELFSRARRHFGTNPINNGDDNNNNFDMDVFAREFSCSDSALVLPKHYATLDSEFYMRDPLAERFEECKDFGKVAYMHFTRRGKPWSSPRDVRGRLYRFGYEDEAEGAFERWFQVAHSVCPWMVEELPSRGEEEEWKKFLVT